MAKKKYTPSIFIRGESVNLIALDEDLIDNSNWYKWFNDEKTTINTKYHVYPNTRELQKEFFKNNIKNNSSKIQLGVYHVHDEILIGVISLNNIDNFNKNCEFSAMLGEPKYQVLKYYLEAARLIITHGFKSLGMQRIYSGTVKKEINDIVCRLLEFKPEGIKRSAIFKDGNFHNIYTHSILQTEFLSSKEYNQK